jgi:tRNA(Ile)-lysidine synthase
MFDRIEACITQHQLFTAATPVVLMVSGGSDSAALAYLAAELHERGLVGPLAMLHVNHKLRGQDAEDDQAFVWELSQLLDIPCFICEIDVKLLASQTGANVEAIGREQRYLAAHDALKSLCRHASMPFSEGRIATAHTQDDRVENFYMRSIKGTGPGGFRSMLYRNGPVVRPLMDVSREDLRAYLRQREADGLPVLHDAHDALWREDATNAHTDRFRSFVRHQIVPRAKEQNVRLLDTLTRTMNLIADEDDYLNQLATEAYEANVQLIGAENAGQGEAPDGLLLEPGFCALPKPLQRRVALAALQVFLGVDSRIDAASVEAVLAAVTPEARPLGGYVANIQGDLAVSANKQGIRIEPMAVYRARRKRDQA